MEKKYARHAIGIAAAKNTSLSLRDGDDSHQQHEVDTHKQYTSHEAKAFSYGAKDKVGSLFRHKIITRLCSAQQALSNEAAATYGYLTLFYVIVTIIFF